MFATALVYVLAVISPGPNFLLVSRFSSSNSLKAGLGATTGIVMVGCMFSTASVTGLAFLIQRFPSFSKYAAFAGAAYLIYVALTVALDVVRRSNAGSQEVARNNGIGFRIAWTNGVLTNIMNVKTIAFMISIFAAFLSKNRNFLDKVSIISICSSLEFAWYCSVALVFGHGPVKRFYTNHRKAIDLSMVLFLIFFAIKTAVEA